MKNFLTGLGLFLIISIYSTQSFANNQNHNDWKQGVIFLEDKIIAGDIIYDHTLDLVLLKDKETVQVYTPQVASAFEFYDEEMGVVRSFDAMNKNGSMLRGQKEFYEVVFDGDLTLVRKGKSSIKKVNIFKNTRYPLKLVENYEEADLNYIYYLKSDDGLVKIKNFKKQVLPLMADRKQQMEEHLDKHRFKLYNPRSYMLVINYYNHLKKATLAHSTLK